MGLLVLYLGRSLLQERASQARSSKPLAYKKLTLLIALLALFYGCEEQLGSTFVLFSERHVLRETLFGCIPAASLVMFNPLTILIGGPFIQRICLPRRTKLGIGFLLLAAAFSVLYFSCGEAVPIAYMLSAIVLISIGELFIGPTILVSAAELAPAGRIGATMGAVSLGFSMANLLSGLLSQMMAVTIPSESVAIYMRGFLVLTLGALLVSVILLRGVQKNESRIYK